MVCSAACPAPRWHRVFLARFMPATVARAKYVFRHLRGQDYQDAIQETIANALVAFVAHGNSRAGNLALKRSENESAVLRK